MPRLKFKGRHHSPTSHKTMPYVNPTINNTRTLLQLIWYGEVPPKTQLPFLSYALGWDTSKNYVGHSVGGTLPHNPIRMGQPTHTFSTWLHKFPYNIHANKSINSTYPATVTLHDWADACGMILHHRSCCQGSQQVMVPHRINHCIKWNLRLCCICWLMHNASIMSSTL